MSISLKPEHMSEPGWMGASDRSTVLTTQSINRNQRKIMELATMVQMKTTTYRNDHGNWQPKNMSHARRKEEEDATGQAIRTWTYGENMRYEPSRL